MLPINFDADDVLDQLHLFHVPKYKYIEIYKKYNMRMYKRMPY